MRNLSLPVPINRSQVHLTSAAVKGLPSCHLTPWRSEKVSSLPSSAHSHLVARSGTIEERLFCATCWSYNTRLLKTPIIGCSDARVDSSRIDMLAGLSKCWSRRTPPDFCASDGPPVATAISNPATAGRAQLVPFIRTFLPSLREAGYLSSQTSSIRQPLKRLLAIWVNP